MMEAQVQNTPGQWGIYSDDSPQSTPDSMARVSLGNGSHVFVDEGIAQIVRTLRLFGIDTLWSCQGGPGHMAARPTVIARVQDAFGEMWDIRAAMYACHIRDYWVSLVSACGSLPTRSCQQAHGGKQSWLIELPGPHDFLATPVALEADYLIDVKGEWA